MINYNESDIQHTRREDMMRLAEESRIARDLQHEKHTPLYAAALAKLGDVMVGVGSHLQERYGELVEEVQQSAEAARKAAPKVTKIA